MAFSGISPHVIIAALIMLRQVPRVKERVVDTLRTASSLVFIASQVSTESRCLNSSLPRAEEAGDGGRGGECSLKRETASSESTQ